FQLSGADRRLTPARGVVLAVITVAKPATHLQFGSEVIIDSKDYTASRSQSPIGAGELEPESVDPSADFVSWDASIRYQPTRSFTAFVRAATAYRAPSIQGRLLFGDVITIGDEEDILSFEAGIKAGLADNRIRLGLTGYLYTLNNQQLTAVGGGANFNQLINVDQTQGSGAEFELDVLPIANLFIRVGVGLNVTEIQDPEAQVAVCGAPCTVFYDVGDGDDGLASLDGNPLPNAPEWTASLIARYDIPVDEVSNVFLNTDWAYRSAVEFFLYRSAEFRDSSLVQGGARVGYSYNGGEIEAALFSRNITGNLSKTGAIDFNNLTAFVNEPRTFGVEVRANY
ncbi:MAG: TonB-dependent receptor, partial [Myxococcota bacterium]